MERNPGKRGGPMSRPVNVENARLANNREALSAMGRKGAEATNKQRDLRVSSDAALAEKRKALFDHEMHQRAVEANEHIVPVDGDDKETAH